MTAIPPQGPVVKVKPQPGIYAVLLLVAILFVGTAAVVVLHDLMTSYGMSFGDVFSASPPLP